ncbi:MAG TPA: GNAT family N-acetyltransferase, partial [Anaerolineae bacterium]|nr:GNAT family N-acetyltransferase [Anaerolineae bacterium]
MVAQRGVMTITIRPFNFDDLDDYEALEIIGRNTHPDDYPTVSEIRYMDKLDSTHFRYRLIAEHEEKIIAWVGTREMWWFAAPDQYTVNGAVLSDWQEQGVGGQLWQAIQRVLAEKKAVTMMSWVREDFGRSKRFLENRGFVQVMRDAQSQLDLASFDASRFAGITDKMDEQGIKLYNLLELAQIEPNWKQKVWEMRWPIRQDIPSSEEKKPIPYDEWHKFTIDAPDYTPAGFIVAIAPDGEYIGWSNIKRSDADPKKLYTGVTGVKRAWRRKGIATALKLRVIAFAQANGFERIVTENEENNPM